MQGTKLKCEPASVLNCHAMKTYRRRKEINFNKFSVLVFVKGSDEIYVSPE